MQFVHYQTIESLAISLAGIEIKSRVSLVQIKNISSIRIENLLFGSVDFIMAFSGMILILWRQYRNLFFHCDLFVYIIHFQANCIYSVLQCTESSLWQDGPRWIYWLYHTQKKHICIKRLTTVYLLIQAKHNIFDEMRQDRISILSGQVAMVFSWCDKNKSIQHGNLRPSLRIWIGLAMLISILKMDSI